MKVTTSLLVKNFLSRLHPPGPATPQQSRQLLNILETSFRRHLDEVHPAPGSQNHVADRNIDSSPSFLHEPINAANLHLDAVLRHPLVGELGTNWKPLQGMTGNAVATLNTALLDGSIKVKLLQQCAQKYYIGIKNGEKVDARNLLGQRIAAWISTADSTTQAAFLTDSQAIADVLPVMYVDGLEEVVWNWLRMLYARPWISATNPSDDIKLHDIKLLKAEDHFVSRMMQVAIRQGSLEDAAHQFVQATQYRAASGRAAVEMVTQASDAMPFNPLLQSWKRLSTSILYRRRRHGISESCFDRLLAYGIPFSNRFHVIGKAFLLPFHPTRPTAQPLCQELDSSKFVSKFLLWQTTLDDKYHKAFLMAILDSAQLSLDQNRATEARFLLDFAETHYPRFISAKQDTDTAQRLHSARQEVEPQGLLNFHLDPS